MGQRPQSEQYDFRFACKINGLKSLILVEHPCTTRNHESISDSYRVFDSPMNVIKLKR
jgi:hypothetical protein